MMHLGVSLSPFGLHPAAWREKGATPRALEAGNFAAQAQKAQDGALDFVLIPDAQAHRPRTGLTPQSVPFDPTIGEFRIHYAGFFDPGFGYGAGDIEGTRAVLEVRSHEVPFVMEDGQIVASLVYEPLTERPRLLYGEGIGSSYQRQGLKLSKHFRSVSEPARVTEPRP